MTEILIKILSDYGFIAFVLSGLLVSIGYFFYWIANKLIKLLEVILKEFLEKFGEMVSSIKNLSKDEIKTQQIIIEEHKKASDEHNRIAKLLDKVSNKIDGCK